MTSWSTNMAPRNTAFFTEDFDISVARRSEPAPDAPETYTAEQMTAAQEAAWTAGHAAGLDASEDTHTRTIQNSLAAINEALGTAHADLVAGAEAAARELAQLLLAGFAAALPAFCARHGAAEIHAIAAEILPALIGEPHVRVQLHSAHLPDLKKYLSDLDAIFLATIQFQPDDTMAPSDIIIRWDQGDAIRNGEAIWQSIQSILAPLGLTAPEPLKQIYEREPAHVQ